MIALIIILVVLGILIVPNIRVVSQGNVYVIERLGKYKTSWEAGLHLKVPFIDTLAKKVSIKEQVGDFPPQPVITKDNVTIQIDTVVFYNVFDANAYTYGVVNPVNALINLTATTLRNIVGALELDETLTSRDIINAQMQKVLDEATDKWGIKVNRVELKNIIPPRDIQESMEKQMRAEREKRQSLLEAEAHRESSITRAEGDKVAMVLKAEAERDAAIARATGEAESIRLKYEAEANGLKSLSEIDLGDAVVIIKKLEALSKLGDGRATKIIVPSDLASTIGNLSAITESLGFGKDIDLSERPVKVQVESDPCCDGKQSRPNNSIMSRAKQK